MVDIFSVFLYQATPPNLECMSTYGFPMRWIATLVSKLYLLVNLVGILIMTYVIIGIINNLL